MSAPRQSSTWPISRIVVARRIRRDHGNVSALADSIREIGLLHPPVVLPDGTLVAGARRLEAVKHLGWREVPVTIARTLDDALAKLTAERDENTQRKALTPEEAVRLADKIEPMIRAAAKARQREHGRTAPGRTHSGKVSGSDRGETRQIVAAAVGLSAPSLKRAREVVAAGERHPDLVAKMNRNGRVDGVHRELAIRLAAEKVAARPEPPPEGPFDVLVVDPPWHYDNIGDEGALPYPTMTIEAIRALPVARIAAPDAVVWLWTTNAHVRQAFVVLDAWGFEQKTVLTWAKDRSNHGYWLRGRTEHCLLATRGRPVYVLNNQTTLLHGARREHSRKPDEFYVLVEGLCPGTKIDLFARQSRPGWSTWGSEVDKFSPTTAPSNDNNQRGKP